MTFFPEGEYCGLLLLSNCSQTDTIKLQDGETTNRDHLMDMLTAVLSDSVDGIAPGTQQKQTGCFAQWRRLLAGVGVNNEFLDGWAIVTKICILCAFAASV